MKRAIITEVVCLVGLLILAVLISEWIISNNALDISAHDTYNLDGSKFSPWRPFIFAFFIVMGFVVYLIRAIFLRFEIFRVCIILAIFTCLILGAIEYSGYSLYSIFSRAYWQYSPNTKGLYFGGGVTAFRENEFLVWLKAFLVLTLAFTSFMTGKIYKNRNGRLSEPEQ